MDHRAKQRQLRQAARHKRRQLNPDTQQRHARRAAAHFKRYPGLRRARRIAFYLAADGELDPAVIRASLARPGRHWFLPVIERLSPPTLAFYRDGDPRQRRPNRFGILEPNRRRSAPVTAGSLDLILLPLVGFDAHGQRIGLGLGFYDRCLATLKHQHAWRHRPALIGLAHECQRIDHIPANPWDVPLDAVLTERRLYLVRRSK